MRINSPGQPAQAPRAVATKFLLNGPSVQLALMLGSDRRLSCFAFGLSHTSCFAAWVAQWELLWVSFCQGFSLAGRSRELGFGNYNIAFLRTKHFHNQP